MNLIKNYKSNLILKNGDYILFYEGKNAYGTLLYSYKILAWRNGITFSIHNNALEEKKIDSTKKNFIQLLTNLHYRSPDDIPTTPGFCFENGFIADDGKSYQYEESDMYFGMKSHPDLIFM